MQLALLLSFTVWFGGDGDAQAVVEDVYAEWNYQREMLPPPEPGEADDTWSRDDWYAEMERRRLEHRRLPDRRGDRERRREERTVRVDPGGGGGSLARFLEILVYIALGVALVTVVVSVIRGWGRTEATIEPTVGEGARAPAAALEAPRSEAEALAAEGRYDEAVHVLLLKTIEALVEAQPGAVPEAWTSREIQREAAMATEARAPFGALVDMVEQSLFGGRPVDAAAWDACLARFHEFERAYRTGRA